MVQAEIGAVRVVRLWILGCVAFEPQLRELKSSEQQLAANWKKRTNVWKCVFDILSRGCDLRVMPLLLLAERWCAVQNHTLFCSVSKTLLLWYRLLKYMCNFCDGHERNMRKCLIANQMGSLRAYCVVLCNIIQQVADHSLDTLSCSSNWTSWFVFHCLSSRWYYIIFNMFSCCQINVKGLFVVPPLGDYVISKLIGKIGKLLKKWIQFGARVHKMLHIDASVTIESQVACFFYFLKLKVHFCW